MPGVRTPASERGAGRAGRFLWRDVHTGAKLHLTGFLPHTPHDGCAWGKPCEWGARRGVTPWGPLRAGLAPRPPGAALGPPSPPVPVCTGALPAWPPQSGACTQRCSSRSARLKPQLAPGRGLGDGASGREEAGLRTGCSQGSLQGDPALREGRRGLALPSPHGLRRGRPRAQGTVGEAGPSGAGGPEKGQGARLEDREEARGHFQRWTH